MKAIKISIMAFALAGAGISAKAQTAEQVLQKHIDAVGGTDNWNKIKTVKLTGTMSQGGMDIGMTETIVNEKGIRMDISAMGQSGYMIITPKEGWMYMPFGGQTKVTEIPAEQLKASQDQFNYKNNQLVDKSMITKVSLDGMDTINSVACHKLKVVGKDGSEQTCFIDTKTFYMVRVEKKLKAGDEEQDASVTFSNFVKQPEGVTIPMTMSPMGQGDITFKTAEFNKPVDDKIFKPDNK